MNRFHILTLFPEMVMDGLNTSIIGRAIEAGLLARDNISSGDGKGTCKRRRISFFMWAL